MSNKTQLQANNTTLDALITRVNAVKDVASSLPEAGNGNSTIETATVTLNTLSYISNCAVYYISDSGIETATHQNSPFVCATPSIFVCNHGGTAISTNGDVSLLSTGIHLAVFAINGAGTITLTPPTGGSD